MQKIYITESRKSEVIRNKDFQFQHSRFQAYYSFQAMQGSLQSTH